MCFKMEKAEKRKEEIEKGIGSERSEGQEGVRGAVPEAIALAKATGRKGLVLPETLLHWFQDHYLTSSADFSLSL